MLLNSWHLKEFHSHSRDFINFWTTVCPVFSYSQRNYSTKKSQGEQSNIKVILLSPYSPFFFVCGFVFYRKKFSLFSFSFYLLLSIAALVLSLAKQCPLLYVPKNNTMALKITNLDDAKVLLMICFFTWTSDLGMLDSTSWSLQWI